MTIKVPLQTHGDTPDVELSPEAHAFLDQGNKKYELAESDFVNSVPKGIKKAEAWKATHLVGTDFTMETWYDEVNTCMRFDFKQVGPLTLKTALFKTSLENCFGQGYFSEEPANPFSKDHFQMADMAADAAVEPLRKYIYLVILNILTNADPSLD